MSVVAHLSATKTMKAGATYLRSPGGSQRCWRSPCRRRTESRRSLSPHTSSCSRKRCSCSSPHLTVENHSGSPKCLFKCILFHIQIELNAVKQSIECGLTNAVPSIRRAAGKSRVAAAHEVVGVGLGAVRVRATWGRGARVGR